MRAGIRAGEMTSGGEGLKRGKNTPLPPRIFFSKANINSNKSQLNQPSPSHILFMNIVHHSPLYKEPPPMAYKVKAEYRCELCGHVLGYRVTDGLYLCKLCLDDTNE